MNSGRATGLFPPALPHFLSFLVFQLSRWMAAPHRLLCWWTSWFVVRLVVFASSLLQKFVGSSLGRLFLLDFPLSMGSVFTLIFSFRQRLNGNETAFSSIPSFFFEVPLTAHHSLWFSFFAPNQYKRFAFHSRIRFRLETKRSITSCLSSLSFRG